MTPHLDTPTLLERRIKAEATLLTLEREQGAAQLAVVPAARSPTRTPRMTAESAKGGFEEPAKAL